MSQGPRRLSAHRMALALALVSAGPPLVVHNGWPGLVLAVIGAAYAAYLLLGKRWPKLRRSAARPAGRSATRPAPSPATRPAPSPATRLAPRPLQAPTSGGVAPDDGGVQQDT